MTLHNLKFLTRFVCGLTVIGTLIVSGGQVAAQQPSTPAPLLPESGKIIADTGFRPNVDGFSFPNYNNSIGAENLTADEMRALFGDRVCAILRDNECVLTPFAAEQMAEFNQAMAAGHCDGLATLSLMIYEHLTPAASFGADTTAGLQFAGNEALQRTIARWFTTQLVDPTYAAKLRYINDKITPAQVLDTLVQAINDKSEAYTIAFFKPGYRGGHAVTPYAVADEGGGIYHILIYDNNFPGQQRAIEIDHNGNTWSYQASINPNIPQSSYSGDATTATLMLVPLSTRLKAQKCDFCEGTGPSASATTAPTPTPTESAGSGEYNEISLTSSANANQVDLLIQDSQGRRLGYQGGQFFTEIPNAFFVPVTSGDLWEDDPEPIFYVPTNIPFTVVMDGSALNQTETASLWVFGPTYDTIIDEVTLHPGQRDTATFGPNGTQLTYQPGQAETPQILFDVQQEQSEYELQFQGVNLNAGAAANFIVNTTDGYVSLNTTGAKNETQYAIEVNRVDDQSDDTFYHPGLTLAPAATAHLDYAQWDGQGSFPIGIDQQSDGSIDETDQESDAPIPTGAGYVQTAGSGTFVQNPDGSYQLQLIDVSTNTIHFSAAEPLAVHTLNTDQFGHAWAESSKAITVDTTLELDHQSVRMQLSDPISDPAAHTLTYTASIASILPTGAVDQAPPLPEAFGIANLVIVESPELLDALTASGQLASLSAGGDINIGAGNLDLTSGGDINIGAGNLPGADMMQVSYDEFARNGAITESNGTYQLTLNGVYPMLLTLSTAPTPGATWVSVNGLHSAWRSGAATADVSAVINSNGKSLMLQLSHPVSDPAQHTLTYQIDSSNMTPAQFDTVNLLFSRNPALEAALNLGVNPVSLASGGDINIGAGTANLTSGGDINIGAGTANLTSGGDINIGAGAATVTACDDALKTLRAAFTPGSPVDELVGPNNAVESACTLSAQLFTPDARRKSAHVSELTILPS